MHDKQLFNSPRHYSNRKFLPVWEWEVKNGLIFESNPNGKFIIALINIPVREVLLTITQTGRQKLPDRTGRNFPIGQKLLKREETSRSGSGADYSNNISNIFFKIRSRSLENHHKLRASS